MSGDSIRKRIVDEIFGRLEKKYSEEELANYLMSLLMDHYPLLSAVTIALDPDGGLSVFAHRGLSGKFIKEMYTGKSFPVLEAARREPVSVGGSDRRVSDPLFRLEHGFQSLYAAPCRLQGKTLGVFLVDSNDPGLLTPEIRESFLAYTRIVTVFLALRDLRGKVSRVPDVDSVTGLYSFRVFHEILHRELTRAQKLGHPASLLFLKVRNLREMNDVYGHVAADAALRVISDRVRGILREVDCASRSGGMIHIVLPQMTKAEAAGVAGKIVEAMNDAPVGKGDIFLTVAIGVTQFPKDGVTERVLIPHTEAMVHESLRKGGNAFTAYRD